MHFCLNIDSSSWRYFYPLCIHDTDSQKYIQRFSEVPYSEITDILAISKLRFCIKKPRVTDFWKNGQSGHPN